MKVLISASKDWNKLFSNGNCGVCDDECGDCRVVGSAGCTDGTCYAG